MRAVVEALKIGDDEVLLCVVWTTKEGRQNHIRYPDVLGVDIIMKRNNEKRPVIRVIGKNQRNKNIPFANGFLPLEQRYVFGWFFNEALPNVLDRDAL